MKLLIVAQRVDREDPVLGFFHRWIVEFARHCEQVTVIGHAVGTYSFPPNVRVLSLGKEHDGSLRTHIRRFLFLCWQERAAYDAVFVHMSPPWVPIGWPIWKILRKRVYLWYEVRRSSRVLTWAVRCARKIFSATVSGMPFVSKKTVVVGHGIDVEQFAPGEAARENGLIVTVGRITRIKHLPVILECFRQLPVHCRLLIVGNTVTPGDAALLHDLKEWIHRHGLAKRVTIGPMTHAEIPALLRRAELVLHACGGGLDKIVLEAMATGCPIVSSSHAAHHVLTEECLATDEGMGEKAKALMEISPERRDVLGKELRKRVVEHHSLQKLIPKLVEEMRN